ncbi:MAG: amino acid adenylation domain-containing protein [Nannocystaceae bacterium]
MSIPARPLTARQLLIWLGHQRASALPADNMVMVFTMEGELDPDRFHQAFASVVADCEALRTVMLDDGIEPQQRVCAPASMPIAHAFTDLSSAAFPQQDADALRDHCAAQTFDPTRCNYASLLLRLAPLRHTWVFVQHHLITDGRSVSILFDHVSRRYAGEAPTPIAAYSLYIDQEATYRQSKAAARDAKFWAPRRTRMVEVQGGYGPVPAPEGPLHCRVERDLGLARSVAIRNMCETRAFRSLSASLSATVLFKTVLFAHLRRVRGDVPLAVGAALHNRDSRKTKNVVGCMIEVAPFSVEVGLDESFATLHKKLLDETITVLRRARHAVPNPLNKPVYDVLYNFHTATFSQFAGLPTHTEFRTGLNSSTTSAETTGSTTAGGDTLVLQVHDFDQTGQLHLTFDFHAARFPAPLRERIPDHYIRLLDALLLDPSQKIGQIDLLSRAEHEELRNTFNPPRNPDVPKHVVSMFGGQVRLRPDATAVRFGTEALTYGQLAKRVFRLARVLNDMGVGPFVTVAVALERSVDLPTALLGILQAGGAYVPLDPGHPVSRNELVLDDADPAVLLTHTALGSSLSLPQGCQRLCIDSIDLEACEDLEARPFDTHAAGSNASHLAYIIFTSGSTGRPKGVCVRHLELANFIRSMASTPGMKQGEGLLAVTTISFDIAGLELLLPLCVGGFVEVASGSSTADPAALAALLSKGDLQVLQATPATFRMLIEGGWPGTPGLRVLCGGEAFPPTLAQPLLDRCDQVWNMYGPTETTVWSSIQRIEPGQPYITIGRPIDNTELYVVDETMNLQPCGVAGELVIGGLGVTAGYHNRPEQTADRFVADPFRPGTIYRTGDMARMLPDGQTLCLGRLDQQVKIRGFRIELGEVEAALAAQPQIAEAVVRAQPNARGESRLVAYLVAHNSTHTLDQDAARLAVREQLPHYMVPSTMMQLPALPRTPNNKIDRKALPDIDLDLESQGRAGTGGAPQNDLEQTFAALYCRVLDLPQVGRDDNFFDLGGDSLSLVRLHRHLGQVYDRAPALASLFQYPTVRTLASVFEQGAPTEASALIALNGARKGAALFCICGIQLYAEVARALPNNPVYGIYVPEERAWLDAAASPDGAYNDLPRVEELATAYVKAIRRKQPQGPYSVAGVSFGGVLAYEIAQQLLAAGQEVAMVALLDTILPSSQRRVLPRWFVAHLQQIRNKGLRHLLNRPSVRLRLLGNSFVARLLRRFRKLSRRRETVGLPRSEADEQRDAAAFVAQLYIRAIRDYEARIRPYEGRTLLIRATDHPPPTGYERDSHSGWRKLLAGNVRCFDVPGDHLGILSGANAVRLSEHLAAALADVRPVAPDADEAQGR